MTSLVKRFVRTSLGQSWITHIFLLCCSYVLQVHLFALLTMLYRFNPIVDFMLDVCLTLAMHDLFWTVSWAVTTQHKKTLSRLLQPIFNPPKQKRQAKSIALTLLTVYVIGIVQLAKIDEQYITLSLIHFIVCHFIREYVLTAYFRQQFKRRMEFLKFYIVPNTRLLENGEEALGVPLSPIREVYFQAPPAEPSPPSIPNYPVPNFRKRVRNSVKETVWTLTKKIRRKLTCD